MSAGAAAPQPRGRARPEVTGKRAGGAPAGGARAVAAAPQQTEAGFKIGQDGGASARCAAAGPELQCSPAAAGGGGGGR